MRSSEKILDNFMIKPVGFTDGLDVEYERKRAVKDTEGFGLRNWYKEVVNRLDKQGS